MPTLQLPSALANQTLLTALRDGDHIQLVGVTNHLPPQSGVLSAAGQTVTCQVQDASSVVVTLSGTFSMGIIFELSVDGDVWFSARAVRIDSGAVVSADSTHSTPVAYRISVLGFVYLRVRATSYTSGAMNVIFAPVVFALEPSPSALVLAGSSLIGDVGVQYRNNATGAASIRHIVSAAGTNPTVVKSGAGRLLGWGLANTTSGWRYLKLHNKASAPTAGSGVVMTLAIAPNSVNSWGNEGGIGFPTGIAFTTVTGVADGDATGVGANDIVGDIFFA